MKVVVDGLIYQQQRFGGVSRIFSEILPRMCTLDPSLQVILFTTGRSRQELPKHSRILRRSLLSVDDILRPRRFWRAVQFQARSLAQWPALRSLREALWHSTYFTLPTRWAGPQVITVYDMIYELYPEQLSGSDAERSRSQKRSSILSADKIICISESTLNDLRDFYDIDFERTIVAQPGCSQVFRRMEASECPRELLRGQPYLLYIGKRGSYKNFATFLKAYKVWHRRAEVDLLVIGAGWSDSERRWLVENGCDEQVQLVRPADDTELACLYNNARIFVHPSLYEGFGIPLLEAMSCGCPIAASRIPSTVEVAGDVPYYFEAQSVESMIVALNDALDNGRDAVKIQAGIVRARQYSWDSCAEKTLQVYHSLAGS